MTAPSHPILSTQITQSDPESIIAAMMAWSLGPLLADLDGAQEAGATALAMATATDSPAAIAHASLVLGGAHAFLGNLSLAENHLTHALDLFTALNDRWGMVATTIRLNVIWSGRGHFQLGNDRLMAILPMTQELDDPILTFSILNDLGATYRGLDALDLAIPYALEAHSVAGTQGDPICRIFARFNLGGIHHELLDMRHAIDLYDEMLAIIDQYPQYMRFAMYCEHNLGETSLHLKRYDAAIAWYDRAISHSKDYADDDVLVEAFIGSGRTHLTIGARDEATALFTEALATLDRAEYRNDATHALTAWRLEDLRSAWTWETVHALRAALSGTSTVRTLTRIEILQALAESTTHLDDLVAANAYLREALEEQERYWQRVAINQSHMAIQISQANEARLEAERAWQEHESIGKAMQEIIKRNAQNEALVGELQMQSAALDRLVREDSLTGIANRRAFDERLRAELLSSVQDLTIVLADVDDFKQINDHHSHVIGDRVLIATASILKQVYRDMGIIARLGGDEFGIILHARQPDQSMLLAQRLQNAVRAFPWRTIAPGLSVTLSIGIVSLSDLEHTCPTDIESLLARVDKRLYEAKRSGKNRVIA